VKWLRDGGVTHVHAHFGTNSTTVAMLCHELGGPPYSFTAHGPEEFDKPQFLGLTEKIERAAFVVAISAFGRSQLYRWCGHEHWPKVHVVHCGVDDAFLGATPAPAPAAPRLACVGRLPEQKGQLLLVRAAAELAREGTPVEIVLVGDGALRGPIESLAKAEHLNGHLRVTGWASNDEVRQQLLASRALVLPSFAEGLPVVIMEALALGRPVISTYVAGIPELVEPGVSGWLVPPGSIQALVGAMREALTAPTSRLDEMGRAGAARVAQRHDARTEAAKLAELFRGSRATPT
jgi:glycosyltransferase involved in cell wall biosynthesis